MSLIRSEIPPMRRTITFPMRPVRGVALASVVARCVQAGTLLILSRLVPLDEFGDAGVLMAIAAALQPVATLRMDGAMLVPEDRDESARLGIAALALASIASVLFAVVLLFAEPRLAALLGLHAGLKAWLIAPALLLASSLGAVGTTALSRAGEFRRLSVARILSAAATSAVSVGLAMAGIGVGAILVCFAFGVALPGIWGLRCLRLANGRATVRSVREAAWRHRHFAMLASPGALFNALALRAPAYVLPGHLGSASFAAVDNAGRVWFTVMNPLIDAATAFLQHRTSGEFRGRHGAQHAVVLRIGWQLFLLAAVGALPVMFAGPGIFGVVFGDTWTVVGVTSAILAPALAVQTAASAMSVVLLSTSRLKRLFAWQATYCVVRFAALLWAAQRLELEGVTRTLMAVDTLGYASLAILAYQSARTGATRAEAA